MANTNARQAGQPENWNLGDIEIVNVPGASATYTALQGFTKRLQEGDPFKNALRTLIAARVNYETTHVPPDQPDPFVVALTRVLSPDFAQRHAQMNREYPNVLPHLRYEANLVEAAAVGAQAAGRRQSVEQGRGQTAGQQHGAYDKSYWNDLAALRDDPQTPRPLKKKLADLYEAIGRNDSAAFQKIMGKLTGEERAHLEEHDGGLHNKLNAAFQTPSKPEPAKPAPKRGSGGEHQKHEPLATTARAPAPPSAAEQRQHLAEDNWDRQNLEPRRISGGSVQSRETMQAELMKLTYPDLLSTERDAKPQVPRETALILLIAGKVDYRKPDGTQGVIEIARLDARDARAQAEETKELRDALASGAISDARPGTMPSGGDARLFHEGKQAGGYASPQAEIGLQERAEQAVHDIVRQLQECLVRQGVKLDEVQKDHPALATCRQKLMQPQGGQTR